MAKKTFKKKNYLKHLPRVGSTIALTMAMASVLATPANAAEVDENALPAADTMEPPIVEETPTTAADTQVIEPAEANTAIEEENTETLAENEETAAGNEQVEQENNTAAQENETLTNGDLPAPELDLPEAPAEPETEGTDVEEYNQEINDYNQEVDDYNDAVDDYNTGVDDYNAEVEAFEQLEWEAYEEDKAAYEEAKTEHENAEQQYEEEMKQYEEDSQAYQDYLDAKAAYDAAYQTYLDALDQYEQDSAAYQQAYQDYLDQKALYDQSKEAFEKTEAAYEKEAEIYDEVTEYNQQVEEKNDEVDEKNAALEDDLHADSADNIDDAGASNAGVTVDPEVLEVLNGYAELNDQHAALLEAGAELDEHTGKDAALDSQEYADYLAAVEAYNTQVNDFNAAVDAYNAAVDAYNAAVETYNANKEGTTDTTTGSSTDTGTAVWGNINIRENTTFGHIDVKYAAAAAKDVTVETDDQGNETTTYSDSVTEYTITGVYINEEAAKNNPNSYGVSYQNNENSTVQTQGLEKQSLEFRTTSHKSASLDPDEGQISFYVTLKDGKGNTHGITVSMNDNTVYPEGTFYAVENKGKLGYFKDADGQGLPIVTIDGKDYYDISGQSVFVVSALTCDGMRAYGDTLEPDGLDLVLNLQTLIEIHKSDNAKKLSYTGYEKGKTAQAESPTDPGEFDQTPPTEPTAPTAPEFDQTPPDYVPDPGDPPQGPGEFTETEPEAPVPLHRLNHVEEKLEKLKEKIVIEIPDDPIPDDPIPGHEGEVEILDEEVPLAAVPKTGNLSALWAAISGMSLGGVFLVNRKRREEE